MSGADIAEMPGSETGPVVVEARNGRRAAWTFFDQALSSLTNAALAILVASKVSAGEFGAFTLALITFSFVTGVGRGLISDPFVVRFSDADQRAHRAASARAAGAGVSFGLASSLICAAAGIVLRGDPQVSTALFALAVSLPGLMIQDIWRHIFFAAGRPAAAAMNDLVWTVVQFALLGLLLAAGSRSVFWITLAWGFAALVAAVIGVFQTGVLPRPSATLAWFRETRDLNVRMALDFALNMGAINLAIYVISAIVGLAGTGALRAAQVLLGPLTLLYAGLSSFVLPALSRRAGSGRSLIRASLLTSVASGGLATVWVAILVVLPDSLGVRLLGASWAGAHRVMLGSGVVAIAVGCVIGASLGLKALRRADQMLKVTLMQAPFMLGLGVLGAFTGGAVGAAWGFAGAQVFGLVVCWMVFLQAHSAPREWIGQP